VSPNTPDDGGEPSPALGHPLLTNITCPKCGFEIPPIAQPVTPPGMEHRALIRKPNQNGIPTVVQRGPDLDGEKAVSP